MTPSEPSTSDPPQLRDVSPDELTDGFHRLGLSEGGRVTMHASLSKIGTVEGGARMVLHRLTQVLGKKGTLVMPTFTAATRHSSTHDNFTKAGCWCEGRENRHLPFILELQPDREIGEIAHQLCSWPAARRSRHPAFSFAAVGRDSDNLVRQHSLADPLVPLKMLLKEDAFVLTIGVELDSVSAIHIAEQRYAPAKFAKERALTVGATGPTWVELTALGCSEGFRSLAQHVNEKEIQHTDIGSAQAFLYPMKHLVSVAEQLLEDSPKALACGRVECLSCPAV